MDTDDLILTRIAWKIRDIRKPDLLRTMLHHPTHNLDLNEQHWHWEGAMQHGRAVIKIPGTNKVLPIVRFMFEKQFGEELSADVRAKRSLSCGFERCVNPAHFDLQAIFNRKLEERASLPTRLTQQAHDEIDDLVEELRYAELDLTQPAHMIRELHNPDFSTEEYEEAIRRLNGVE